MTKRFLVPISTYHVDFDTAYQSSSAVGRLNWDDGEGTLNLGLKGGNVNLSMGQEMVVLCYNGSGSDMSDGDVVYIQGAQGQRPNINLASASSEASSSKTLGIVTEPILAGQEGFVTTFGIVNNVNTFGFTEGAALWLDTTAGAYTETKATSPDHLVFIGYCLKASENAGRIFVSPQNGYEIEELHDVLITSIADNHVLSYDNATGLWKNQGLAAAIQEIDGAGSNIDADLLDGQQGSYYAPINSPTFTGIPAAPTASAGTNTTQIATTAFVRLEVANLVDSAPTTLDTLNELAAALGDDPNFATTVTDSLALKAPLNSPTFTGTVDFTSATVLGISAGSQVYYQTSEPSTPEVGDIWVDSDEVITTLNSNDYATKEYVDSAYTQSMMNSFMLAGM